MVPSASSAPVGHHDHRIAELVHDGQLVLDHQDRHALAAQRDQLVADPPGQVRVHPGHRLIEQQHAGLGHQRAHDLDQPALAAAQVTGVVVGQVVQAEPGQDGLARAIAAVSSAAPVPPAGDRARAGVPAVTRRRGQAGSPSR